MSKLCNTAIGAIRHNPNRAIDVVLYVLAQMGASDVAESYDESVLGNYPPRDWNDYKFENGQFRLKDYENT